MQAERSHWSGQFGFILAAMGSAIGLGNIWKFPFITHENGGGAFVLLYLVCIVLVGMPIMLAEIFLGKSTALSPVGAFRRLSESKRFWPWVGGLATLSSFVILSYYSVVAGWVLYYIYSAFTGHLEGLGGQELAEYFNVFVANDGLQLFFHLLVMLLITGIVIGGVKRGIERANKVLMPMLLAMLVFGTVYSVWHFAGMEAARFLFDPSNFHALAPGAILEALGHSFFTLSLGMGAMITYGSYMDDREHVMSNGFWIVLADTGIAITACFLIYSILFSFGESVEAGPGLIFVTLPHLLEQMVGGSVATGLLFILVLFAAITSAVSMLEVVVSFVVDEFSLSRKQATFLSATAIFLFGVPSALSMGALADVRILGRNLFDFWDYMASNWMLPIGGFFTALFVAYVVPRRVLWDNVGESWPVLFPGWRFILRWVTPILVILVVLKTTGFMDLIWS